MTREMLARNLRDLEAAFVRAYAANGDRSHPGSTFAWHELGDACINGLSMILAALQAPEAVDADRIRALEDALIDSLWGGSLWYGPHRNMGDCPDGGHQWDRDPECPACQRLEALIGHRRPKETARGEMPKRGGAQ